MNRLKSISVVLGLTALHLCTCTGTERIPAPLPSIGSTTVTNVVDYGAAPNDERDDTAAVTTAINACNGSNTKTLYFPGGRVNLSIPT